MATTVNLGQQLQFENQNVSHLPPRPPSSSSRPLSGCFHNRGRLFSTLKQQSTSDSGSTYTNSPLSTRIEPSSPRTGKTNDYATTFLRHRRVQSAKARLERSATQHANGTHTDETAEACTGSNIAVYNVNMNLDIDHTPFQRNPRVHSEESKQFLHKISLDRSARRPSSAKADRNSAWVPTPILPATQSADEEEEAADDLKPSVYGYRLKRQVFGSNPDIFTAAMQQSHASTMFKLDETHIPVSREEQKLKNGHPDTGRSMRTIPWHLEPLRPWLTQTVPQEVIGVDPSTCLVFLPLNQAFDNLPVVPLS